ncbi:MAG: tetratricopeptide repeat protein [Lachnospiraceae bacterium]|nr:tetratricopeptide repeat protein [Lachnospiraceae bacterium]
MKKNLIAAILSAGLLLGACGVDGKLDDAADAMREEKYVKAINLYEEVLDSDAKNVEAYKGLIKASLLDGRGDNAQEYYNLAKTQLDSDDFRELKRQRENFEKQTLDRLDTLHTVILTVMMDPEIVNRPDYAQVFKAWSDRKVALSELETTPDWEDYSKAILKVSGERKLEDLTEEIFVYGEMEPNVFFRFENVNRLKIWIEGYESEFYAE